MLPKIMHGPLDSSAVKYLTPSLACFQINYWLWEFSLNWSAILHDYSNFFLAKSWVAFVKEGRIICFTDSNRSLPRYLPLAMYVHPAIKKFLKGSTSSRLILISVDSFCKQKQFLLSRVSNLSNSTPMKLSLLSSSTELVFSFLNRRRCISTFCCG